jgi:hypothetical protein
MKAFVSAIFHYPEPCRTGHHIENTFSIGRVMTFHLRLTISLVITMLLHTGLSEAGTLYTEKELWAVGNLWKETKAEWECEVKRNRARLAEIEASDMPRNRKDFLLQKEARYHRAVSQQLAQQRAKVQNVLIDEANARVSGGRTAASEKIHATLGTKIDDPAHRGIRGDLDAQAGSRTIQKVQDTLVDMGLKDLILPLDQRRPGTLDLGDNFEMTIHRTGIEPKVGDEFHHIKNQIDARNPEVYLSERMRDRAAGTKQVGTDYVEVQDHLKKARKGHLASGPDLIKNPDKIQSMAKGTIKTLDMGTISDEELGAMLKQRGLEDSPAEFKKKLAGQKNESLEIRDATEAAKIRDVSEDIFKKAEQRTQEIAQNEIATKKKAIEIAEQNLKKLDGMADNPEVAERKRKLRESIDQKRRQLREELIDSQSKMKAAKAANDESLAHAKGNNTKSRTDAPSSPKGNNSAGAKSKSAQVLSGKTKVPAPVSPDSSTNNWNKIKGGSAKAMEGFGAVMNIADIGNTCKKLEEYQEGKATAGEVLRAVVDVTPISGLIGAAEKTGSSISDYSEARSKIDQANQQNMEAYLMAWEKQFREAGMDRADARRYVANAMLSGNLDVLEAKADQLRVTGNPVEIPVLIVEDAPDPDGGDWFMWENTKDVVVGMCEGAESGVSYIVSAPGRVVTAFGERELAEADLDYNAASAESDMKIRLFRSLLNAGVDRDKALKAVQEGGATLKAASREARENLAEARKKQEEEDAAQQARQEQINAIHRRISDLRFMDLPLKSDPFSPVPIPRGTNENQEMEINVSIGGGLASAVERIKNEINQITGTPPQITINYAIGVKGAMSLDPGEWKITLPAKANLYPITAQATITISGLTGDLAPLTRVIQRELTSAILFQIPDESIKLTQSRYEFQDGDSEPIIAEVSGKVEGRNYYFAWMVDKTTKTTTDPELLYNATLSDSKVGERKNITVALCDRANGCILDQASAEISISPVIATGKKKFNQLDIAEKVWKGVEDATPALGQEEIDKIKTVDE